MAKRLVESYQVTELVEICFGKDVWLPATVRELQHPGIWAQTADGRLWFVTNTKHIRRRDGTEQ
ncbi:MAG: hypothetical protein KBE23_10420 [Chloroflexi bacterium]|nr:hypothetical protein [Chloroflexota bacterium]MBP7043148.1 hypothetical protein [Chloroflexota bacterium]